MPRKRNPPEPPSQTGAADSSGLRLVLHWTLHGVQALETTQAKVEVPPEPSKYGASVGLKCRDRSEIIRALKKGLPVSAFKTLLAEIGISAKTLAGTADIALRTLSRRKRSGRLQIGESERLFRIGALYDRAVEVLGDKQAAREWFKSPKRALGGKSPLEYADTEPGAREVEDLLGRIEHGVFS